MVGRSLAIAFLYLTCTAVRAEEEPAEWSNPIPASAVVEASGDHFTRFIRKLPCRTGSFRTLVTVQELRPVKKYDPGAAIQFFSVLGNTGIYLETDDLAPPPLSAHIFEGTEATGKMIDHRAGGSFPVGKPVEVTVGWTDSQLVFSVAGRALGTFHFPHPTHIVLFATGSRTKFDQNSTTCDLAS